MVGRVKLVREHLAVSVLAGRAVDIPTFVPCFHSHDEWELTLINHGTGTRLIGDHIGAFRRGELVLLGPNLPHSWTTTPARTRLRASVVHFDASIPGLADRLPPSASLRHLLDRASYGVRFSSVPGAVHDIMAELASIDEPNAESIAQLFVVLGALGTLNPGTLATNMGIATNPEAQQRLDTVCDYILNQHPKPITLAEVAGIARMAPAAFSRFFRRNMGRTFSDYLTEVRLTAASTLLRETDSSVSTVAAQVGFANLANFNRQFRRRHDTTPRMYRRAAAGVDTG